MQDLRHGFSSTGRREGDGVEAWANDDWDCREEYCSVSVNGLSYNGLIKQQGYLRCKQEQ